MSDPSNGENKNWWKKILGGLIVVYIVLIIFVPKASEDNEKKLFPGRLETPDVILMSLAFLFNSGLVERLRNLTLSKDEINIELGEIKQGVEKAKKVVEEVEEGEKLKKAKEELDLLNTRIRLLKGHLK